MTVKRLKKWFSTFTNVVKVFFSYMIEHLKNYIYVNKKINDEVGYMRTSQEIITLYSPMHLQSLGIDIDTSHLSNL